MYGNASENIPKDAPKPRGKRLGLVLGGPVDRLGIQIILPPNFFTAHLSPFVVAFGRAFNFLFMEWLIACKIPISLLTILRINFSKRSRAQKH